MGENESELFAGFVPEPEPAPEPDYYDKRVAEVAARQVALNEQRQRYGLDLHEVVTDGEVPTLHTLRLRLRKSGWDVTLTDLRTDEAVENDGSVGFDVTTDRRWDQWRDHDIRDWIAENLFWGLVNAQLWQMRCELSCTCLFEENIFDDDLFWDVEEPEIPDSWPDTWLIPGHVDHGKAQTFAEGRCNCGLCETAHNLAVESGE